MGDSRSAPESRVEEAARSYRASERALTSQYAFGPDGKIVAKFYADGTAHSVEEMARRLEACDAARNLLDSALATEAAHRPLTPELECTCSEINARHCPRHNDVAACPPPEEEK